MMNLVFIVFAIYVNNDKVTYYESFVVEHILIEIKNSQVKKVLKQIFKEFKNIIGYIDRLTDFTIPYLNLILHKVRK